MGPRMRVGIVALVGLLAVGAAAAGQFPALNVGTVTARIDGAPFSAVVNRRRTWRAGTSGSGGWGATARAPVGDPNVGIRQARIDRDS